MGANVEAENVSVICMRVAQWGGSAGQWERLGTRRLGMIRAWGDDAGAVDREVVSWLYVDWRGIR
jgi:hypothetical protein